VNVVFVHPSYPNQFTGIAHGLGRRDGWDCACLVNEGFTETIRQDGPPIGYYGFREEAREPSGSFYVRNLEAGARCGKAVAEALARLHAEWGIDCVVGHAAFGTTFFVKELLDVPVVSYVELPGYFPVHARAEFPAQYPQRLMDVSLRALIHTSVLRSDLCIVPSRHARRLFPAELRPKIRVQMEGFRTTGPVTDRAALRRELGLPHAAPLVGFAGRTLEAVRGFDVFVQVVKRIRARRPDAAFLVVGDAATLYGNETAYLDGRSFKQHVLDTEGIAEHELMFRPFMAREQFVRHLQAVDVMIFPLFEGAANWGLFEAMAAGVPILASRRCFLAEVIRHGRDGLLLDVRDVEGFATAALAILDAPARFAHLGRNAARTIVRRFSPERAEDGYAAILSEAVVRYRHPAERAGA
jgi:glycosyltransferase involved in cell wall biosynthesis